MKQVGIIGLLLLLIFTHESDAQSFFNMRRERNLMVNLGSGTANYWGDLVNPNTLGKVRYNIVAGAEYYPTGRISIRPEFTFFRLVGDDAVADDDRVERNLSFFSNNWELSAVGTISLFHRGKFFYERPGFNVYAFAGLGLLYMNPKAVRENGEKVALQPLQTEGIHYSRFQPVIPYGLGVKLRVSMFFNVIIEGGTRLLFTDYLDDVSSERYVDPTLLNSDLAREMADRRRERDPNYPIGPNVGKRGNPDNNDGYFIMNIKVQYFLPPEFNLRFSNPEKKLRTHKRIPARK
jgi:hypothetical protein